MSSLVSSETDLIPGLFVYEKKNAVGVEYLNKKNISDPNLLHSQFFDLYRTKSK